MKNLFKNLMLVAVAAMAFTACSKDNNDVNAVSKITRYEFTANIADDTRSGFAEKEDGATAYKSEWFGNETLKLFVTDYNGYNVETTAAINDKYDAVDGKVTDVTAEEKKKDSTVQYAYKGEVIKRWIENSGKFTVVKGEDGAIDTYTTTTALIAYAKDNGDGTATIAFNGKFGDSTVYEGVCTILKDVVAMDPSLMTYKLVGFAVNEDGKLPKIYTLAESGLEIRAFTYNVADAQAELTYRKYGATDTAYTFVFVVAAYDANGKMLALKAADTTTTLNSETPDGVNTLTFAPEFTAEVNEAAARYKVFMLDSLTSAVPVYKSVKVSK